MWGWADANRMTKKDVKSLDVFGLGIVWAELLAGSRVILANEESDPPRFRLLEILQKVDRPTEEDLKVLSFSSDEELFIKCFLSGDVQALLRDMQDPDYPHGRENREKLLRSPYLGIRGWLGQMAAQLSPHAQSPMIIQSLARFSYRARPTVGEVLENHFFYDLYVESPPQGSMPSQAPPIDDVRDALDEELKHQVEGRNRARSSIHTEASEDSIQDEANVKASVRQVYNQVRAELGRSKHW